MNAPRYIEQEDLSYRVLLKVLPEVRNRGADQVAMDAVDDVLHDQALHASLSQQLHLRRGELPSHGAGAPRQRRVHGLPRAHGVPMNHFHSHLLIEHQRSQGNQKEEGTTFPARGRGVVPVPFGPHARPIHAKVTRQQSVTSQSRSRPGAREGQSAEVYR
jgi:hypothetical protein